MAKKSRESILVVCAHSDDQLIGAGGTIAKYAREGKKVHTIIFSFGEKSHPWLQRRVTVEMRVREAHGADKVVGGRGVTFLGLTEGKFLEELASKKSIDDPLPDHRAVYKSLMDVLNKTDFKGEVYSFNVWNPLTIKNRKRPRMIVDISKTFKCKIEALRCFKSQRMALLQLVPAVWIRAIKNGFSSDFKYGEKFYGVK